MSKNGKNTLLYRYIKDIEKSLPCAGEDRKQILATLEDSVSTYLQEFPEATLDDITQRFGTPAQIADAFFDIEGASCNREKIPLFKKILLCVLIIVTVVTIALGTIYVSDMHDFFHGNYEYKTAHGTPPPENGVQVF